MFRESTQSIVPRKRELRGFHAPAEKLSLLHVGGESVHDARMRRLLNKVLERGFTLPGGKGPKALGKRASQKRIAENTICGGQLPGDLGGIHHEGENAPMAFQWEIGEKREKFAVGIGRGKRSPRDRTHDHEILSHVGYGEGTISERNGGDGVQ
jgi:hypothetical protein